MFYGTSGNSHSVYSLDTCTGTLYFSATWVLQSAEVKPRTMVMEKPVGII